MISGSIILVVVAVIIYFGLAERILDRMNMTDRTALAWLAALLLGSYVNITLIRRPAELTLNVGGGIVTVLLAIYIISRANEAVERQRAVAGIVVTAAVIYGLAKIVPDEHAGQMISYVYVFAGVAALVAYLAGRSRRGAFVAGLMGIWLADAFHYVELLVRGIPGRTWIGGAGAFDAIVIAGLGAVILAEVVGEVRERMVRVDGEDERGEER